MWSKGRIKIAALAAACVVHLLTTRAAAEPAPPPWRFRQPPTITTPRGTVLELPPGYYLAEPTWSALDAELRRLQERETRLEAENTSLRKSTTERPPGWGTLALVTGALATGIAVGVYASR